VGDVEQGIKDRITHFFEHYKDLEKGKWVKVEGWGDAAEAKQILVEALARYQADGQG